MNEESDDEFTQALLNNLNRNVARDNSVLHPLIQDAIAFAIQIHEIDQKQKRKGKNIPYITHPLTVGLILARAEAPIDITVAGILHDTLEDSIPEKSVTAEMLRERFGPCVADIVVEVTEKRKERPWTERKREALRHIKTMEGPSLWVKTADIISNVSEIINDYIQDGDHVFDRFNAPKQDIVANYRAVIDSLIKRWTNPTRENENLMVLDLKTLAFDLTAISEGREIKR